MASAHHINNRLHPQRGAVTIWFVITLPVLLGFAALAVDLARINLVRTELQNAADAAALAGARSLSDAGGNPFNWTAATSSARAVAQRNFANGSSITGDQVNINTGYWNLQNPSSLHNTQVSGDVPAVSATVSLNGLTLLFARILGISEKNVQASAIAAIAPPASGSGVFPFVISRKMFELYWDPSTGQPRIDPNTNAPYELNYGMYSTYFDKFNQVFTSGTWSTLDIAHPNTNDVVKLMTGELTANVYNGMSINLSNGVEGGAYNELKNPIYKNKKVALLVVDNLTPGTTQTVTAIAGFQITGTGKNNGKSYISGKFINVSEVGTLSPGNGTGVAYGAYTPPILVQ